MGLAVLLTTALLYVLYTWGVPLGESGKFVYRYSKLLPTRLVRAGTIVPIIGLFAWALWLLARGREGRGLLVGAAGVIGLMGWVWYVPPDSFEYHELNLFSTSHEGAFVLEGMVVPSLGEYLRGFDSHRLPLSVEQMRGTRILSNTPGMTVVAYLVRRSCNWDVDHPSLVARYVIDTGARPQDAPLLAYAFWVGVTLTVLWGLSAGAAYGLGRAFLSPLGAGVLAILVTFNPATANFVPGKDPGQLLTINLMLWAWFYGVKRRSAWASGIAGALLVIGMAWGLIHLWVALAAWLAALRISGFGFRVSTKAAWLRAIAPALGALVVVATVYALCGWNMLATFLAVARRYREVQQWIHYDRGLWALIGAPLFLLFVSPALYALIVIPRRPGWRPASPGWRILAATIATMALVYVVGVTYELPRLWVAFVPLLSLGAAVNCRAFGPRADGRVLGLAVALVIVNCLTTAMHVAALDAREAEFRLRAERPEDVRMFN